MNICDPTVTLLPNSVPRLLLMTRVYVYASLHLSTYLSLDVTLILNSVIIIPLFFLLLDEFLCMTNLLLFLFWTL